MRLDKFISINTTFSRSEIRIAARRGKILVNGVVEQSFDRKINPTTDSVKFYDKIVLNFGNVYLLLNKPEGILSASNDKNKKTVIDILPEKFRHLDLFPVGRLDKDTTGLLIITNDGDFAHKVISPKNNIPKTYLVTLDNEIDSSLIEKFSNGVILADGTCCKPSKLEIVNPTTAKLTITEGKYHQIKRMFGVFNLGVNKLHRLSIGDLLIPEFLKQGETLEITTAEIMNKVLKPL